MVSLDGYVAFSPLTATDLPPSVASLNAGPPRCAVFWTDLVLGQGSVTSIVDATPGSGVPAYWEVQYSNVQSAVDGQSYDFAFKIDVTGLITMTFWHPFGVPSSSELQATGIAPGFSISFAGIKDLSSCSLFPYSGNVMESIAEAFGYASNPSWPYLVDRPFDLAGSSSGSELYFWPSGAGPLPGSSNRYVAFRLDL
jgi:hypothetical protein